MAQVERALRLLKTIDWKVRPLHHRLADRVLMDATSRAHAHSAQQRAHIFLCVLAYYVEGHLRLVWRPLMFADEDQEAKSTREPLAPAKRSAKAQRKLATKTQDIGSPLQASPLFSQAQALLCAVRHICRTPAADPEAPTFTVTDTQSCTKARSGIHRRNHRVVRIQKSVVTLSN